MALRSIVAALLGMSAFRPAGASALGLQIDDPLVEQLREIHGGQLHLPPQTQTRWYLKDLELAKREADQGHLSRIARLMRSARSDGVYAGVLSTRTGGLVRLPRRFRGNPDIIRQLEAGPEESRSIFDEMFPATELARLAADGLELGVGVGELLPVEGRDHPVLVRLDPEWLRYSWADGRWYYRSLAGDLEVTPGDGRWVLHMPGGRVSPWHDGIGWAVGAAHIRKSHAQLHKDNWEGKLANPARAAVSPNGASEGETDTHFQSVLAWGKNTVFGLRPGYDVKIIESNGRGHESFDNTIGQQNDEFKMAVAGQVVTSDGGAGFQNSDIHKSIRADLIEETADALAHTINTQGLPVWILDNFGEEALENAVSMGWDVTPPKDRNSEAQAMTAAASAMQQLTTVLGAHGLHLDVRQLAITFGIPLTEEPSATPQLSLADGLDLAQQRGLQADEQSVRALVERMGITLEGIPEGESAPRPIELAPTDIAKVVRVREARATQGLPAFGDERDDMTIAELSEQAKAAGEVEVVEAEADAEPEEQAA